MYQRPSGIVWSSRSVVGPAIPHHSHLCNLSEDIPYLLQNTHHIYFFFASSAGPEFGPIFHLGERNHGNATVCDGSICWSI